MRVLLIFVLLVSSLQGATLYSVFEGQSNMVGQGNGYVAVIDTTKSRMYLRSNKIKGLADPVHVDSGLTASSADYNGASITKGSCAPAMANFYTATSSKTFVAVPCAKSSTGLILDADGLRVGYRWLSRNASDHDDSTYLYGKALVNINRAIAIQGWDDSSAIWIHYKGGEADQAIALTDQADSLTSCYNQIYNGIRQLYAWHVEDLSQGGTRPVKMIVYGMGRRNAAQSNTAAWETVDRAMYAAATQTSGVYWGGSQKTYPLVDAYVHLDSAALNKMGRQGAQIMLYSEGLVSFYQPPKLTVVSDNYDKRHLVCNVTHFGGTSLTPATGDLNAYSFTMSDGTPVARAKIVNGSRIDVHLSRTPTAGATLRYLWGDQKNSSSYVLDNSTVAFLLNPLYDSGTIAVTWPTLSNPKSTQSGRDFNITVNKSKFTHNNPYLMQYFDLSKLPDTAWSLVNSSVNNIQVLRNDNTVCDVYAERLNKVAKKGLLIFSGVGRTDSNAVYKIRITDKQSLQNNTTIFTKLNGYLSYSMDSVANLRNRLDNYALKNSGATNVLGRIDSAVWYTGTRKAYDSSGNLLKFGKNQAFTIVSMFRVTGAIGATQGILAKYATAGNGMAYFINTSGSIALWMSNNYSTNYINASAFGQTISGYTNWHPTSVTYYGDMDGRNITFTYDSTVYGANAFSNTMSDSIGVSARMTIGTMADDATTYPFVGYMDETMVFTKAMGDSSFIIPLQKNILNLPEYWTVDSVGTLIKINSSSEKNRNLHTGLKLW